MSRILSFTALFAVLAAPAVVQTGSAAAAGAQSGSWAQPEIKLVVRHGLMAKSVQLFRPNDPLTRGALTSLIAGLTSGEPSSTVQPGATSVSIAQLDAGFVRALGLSGAAASFAAAARAIGLAPPSRFGTEVVARLLGLRTNHPARLDSLELLPSEPATRAEAAYSAAQVLRFKGWETQQVEQLAESFVLPELAGWQQQVLKTAVRFIGYPYVWGGTSETTEAPSGVQAHGGFDCSGFVWRVYKLQPYPGGAALASTLKGRTTFAMSAEVPVAKRIGFARLKPGDLLFWGAHGPRSKPSEIDHMGIFLGGGWFIHSSRYGVALAQLSGWYRQRFAWARRPLAEAGLTG
jgi:cell wall-associated NlpC family hydrolase